MIKIVAKTHRNDEGKDKTCSFQSTQNKHLTLDDISRVREFVYTNLYKGIPVIINWKIDGLNTPIIKGAHSRIEVRVPMKMQRQLEDMIRGINSTIK